MSDNFEFDDNDDVLLNAFCTPPNDTSPEKRISEGNDENLPVKRPKLDESTPPTIKFSHKLEKAKEKSTPLKNTLLSNAAKRIFPGPAGILSDENQTEIYSQETSSFFQDGPWEEMSKDFKISSLYLYDKFNIAWIKKEATANKFVNQKAPFLAGILLALEVSEGHTQKSVNITLQDMTGTIQGTMLQNTYEENANHLTLGSVLVLTQFGVLSCTCDKCDNHHLTVTQKNLSVIYSGNDKIVIKQVDPEDVLKEYCRRKKELEHIGTLKTLIKQNTFSSPSFSSVESKSCLNRNNMRFQNSCINGSILATKTFNKATNSSENILQKSSGTGETFFLPKVGGIDKSVSETTIIKEIYESNSPTNLGISCPSPSPKKLFTFKKVHNLPKSEIPDKSKYSRLGSCSKLISDKPPSSQNTVCNFEQVNFSDTKKEIFGNKNVDNLEIGKSPLSVTVDMEEHEKILKDILEDVDVNSLFHDDF